MRHLRSNYVKKRLPNSKSLQIIIDSTDKTLEVHLTY